MYDPEQFERRLASTGTTAIVGALVLFAALVYWQAFRTDLGARAGNPRALSAFTNPHRGRILDRDGNELAASLADGTRHYTDASVAHLVGYIDPRYGTQGAELAFNAELTGQAAASWQGAFDAEFARTSITGLDVRLTIDPKVQRAAAQALGSRKGAVVALNPKTGEVLAMVSVPTYDPGALATKGEALLADPSSPLLNRATQGSYPPGSTFKTVTAASALEHRTIRPETIVTCPGEIVIDGFPISCRNTARGVGTYPFRDAYTFSVNAIFAQVGVKLGWDNLLETAARFGFGKPLDFTIETAPTQVLAPGAQKNKVLLATTAFGQGELLATPLQMAVVASVVANGGMLARPHLGLEVDRSGKRVKALERVSTERVLSPDVARTMREFMVSVIDNAQANGVAITGVKVGGKTGTAESGRGTSHAWFIGFAPADDPQVAVAVVVEDGGQGGVVASPIGGQVMRAVLGK
jgi:peptidoglycan glycosyltransferase